MHSFLPRSVRNALSRFASAVTLAFLLMLAAAVARAQCTITGPDVLCGGTASLCGSTEGIYQYYWSGPNGFSLITMNPCLDVTVPGTYSLQMYDIDFGTWYGPCTHAVAAGSNTACSINGPTTACIGTLIDLCGPSGNVSYSWTGPNGFADTSACIHVGVDGAYRLEMTDLSTGCAIAACDQTVAFTTCEAPPGPRTNCPRTARFWALQCGSDESLRSLSGDQLAGIAACVNQVSEFFAWSNPVDGFCGTLNHSSHGTLRARAKRQMAALQANLCAGAVAVATSTGSFIGLDAGTALQSNTIGGWMMDADHQLVTLEGAKLHEKSTKAAYRAIIRTAWNINHGHGIGPVCGMPNHVARQVQNGGNVPVSLSAMALSGEPNAEDAAEPLEVELADDEPEMAINRISPNPTSNRATIAYQLVAMSSQPVTLGVYDLAGRRLRDLVIATQAPGSYVIEWDGRDNSGQSLPGGVYFVRGHAGGQPVISRLTLVR